MAAVIAKVEVECLECGQKQMESENFISTACRGCGRYIQATARTGVGRSKTKRFVVKKRELS